MVDHGGPKSSSRGGLLSAVLRQCGLRLDRGSVFHLFGKLREMAHPFFDVVVYPWTRADAQDLHRVLYQNVTDPGRITLFYQQSGGLRPLTPGSPADNAWAEALNNLIAQRALGRLCGLLLSNATIAAVHSFVQAVVDATDASQEVYLSDGVIFLDRKQLRIELTKLTQPHCGVLLVRGPSGSGKSWTQQMVERFAADRGASTIYLFEGIVSTVEDVFQQLFATFGNSDAVPPRLGSEDAWFKKVCLKLQELAQARKDVLWIVVDDLGDYDDGPRVDQEIRRFFDQFGLTMANPAFSKWFRLVLIDYPGSGVPTKWKQNVWCEDRPNPEEVDDQAVSDFLRRWAIARSKNLGEEKAATLASEILTKASPSGAGLPKNRLKDIHTELSRTLEKL